MDRRVSSITALTRCLAALGDNLAAPVPRSRIRQPNAVADGIDDLAHELARAQRELADRERLAALGRVTAAWRTRCGTRWPSSTAGST